MNVLKILNKNVYLHLEIGQKNVYEQKAYLKAAFKWLQI